MKKLFSFIVLTISCSSLYPLTAMNGQKVRILQDENGQFRLCTEIDENYEECRPAYREEFKKIDEECAKNEKASLQLLKEHLIKNVRYNYLYWKQGRHNIKRLKPFNNPAFDKNEFGISLSLEDQFGIGLPLALTKRKGAIRRIIMDLLPETEQQIFQEMPEQIQLRIYDEINDKKMRELVRRQLILDTRYAYLSWQQKLNSQRTLKSANNNQQEISEKEFFKDFPILGQNKPGIKLSLNYTDTTRTQNQITRDILPKAEQQMFAEMMLMDHENLNDVIYS